MNLFKALGDKHVTDKVSTHRYHPIYEKHLRFRRDDPNLKMLEIGLGCNMPYGEGHSIKVWKDYFPKAHAGINVLEYHPGCIERYLSNTPEMKDFLFQGDQADMVFVDGVAKTIIGDSALGLDFAVDDGGHTMKQMRNSFIALLPNIRPGGVYFIEDLHAGYDKGAQDNGDETIMTLIHDIETVMHDYHSSVPHTPLAVRLAAMIEYFECWREICAFVRK